jgi:anaerobic sulfite reductase subunit C
MLDRQSGSGVPLSDWTGKHAWRQVMKWTKEAEDAISRVPFFVRKRVKKRVEEEAARSHSHEVRMEHVEVCQRRFINNMEEEVRGYQIEQCFGGNGCPNRAVQHDDLIQRLEKLLESKNLKGFLKGKVKGPLKMHHEFRVSVSDCPNACSRPQIVDLGLIGALRPAPGEGACTECGVCVEICREGAIVLGEGAGAPSIDLEKCLFCGQCIRVCPAEALQGSEAGYRILVGGKLGRHPQLGRELEGIFSPEETMKVVETCLETYVKHNEAGERFGDVLRHLPPDDQKIAKRG